jgi:hypothetical protein
MYEPLVVATTFHCASFQPRDIRQVATYIRRVHVMEILYQTSPPAITVLHHFFTIYIYPTMTQLYSHASQSPKVRTTQYHIISMS